MGKPSGKPTSRVKALKHFQSLFNDGAFAVGGSIQSGIVNEDMPSILGQTDVDLGPFDKVVRQGKDGLDGVFRGKCGHSPVCY